VNGPVLREILARASDDLQAPLPLATQGVQRYVWDSRYGSMLIEVIDGQIRVNGRVVEPVSVLDGPNNTGRSNGQDGC
jgi:hypothetical protein